MATQKPLDIIHIFNSEEQFNANKASVGDDDIAFVRLGNTFDYIVETYNDGTNWYRKWASGWLEQGGTVTPYNSGGWYWTTINLIKPYKDTSYYLEVLGNWSDADSSSCYVDARTTSNFHVKVAQNNLALQGFWYACGNGQ